MLTFFLVALNSPTGVLAAWLSRFLDRTQTHPSQRPLPESTQHSQETDMPSAGFEPTIPSNERLQTHALKGAYIRIGLCLRYVSQITPLLWRWMRRESSVSVATRCGMYGPGIESQWKQDFPHRSRPALLSTQSPVQWVPCLFLGS
jgi:hypothetical protein